MWALLGLGILVLVLNEFEGDVPSPGGRRTSRSPGAILKEMRGSGLARWIDTALDWLLGDDPHTGGQLFPGGWKRK